MSSKLFKSTNERSYTPREVVLIALQQCRLAVDTCNKRLFNHNKHLVRQYYPQRHQNFRVLNTGSSVK